MYRENYSVNIIRSRLCYQVVVCFVEREVLLNIIMYEYALDYANKTKTTLSMHKVCLRE